MKDTSRTAALDYLLCIGNLIALADHKEEQIMNLLEERNSLSTVTSDPVELETMATNIQQEIALAQKERDNLYQERKSLQRNFFHIYNIDMDYWCQFKHYAIALTAMEECRNADNTVDNQFVLTRFRRMVYQFLWQAMWVGPANCWRCLADAIEDKPGNYTQQSYGWEIKAIFDPKDYSWSEINYIDEGVIIPENCWRHEEYREWDWWKTFRCAVKD